MDKIKDIGWIIFKNRHQKISQYYLPIIPIINNYYVVRILYITGLVDFTTKLSA